MQPFALSFSEQAQNIRPQKYLLRKFEESFGTEIMKKLRQFQYSIKKLSYKKHVAKLHDSK